jgi:hypothetical protein
MSDPSTPVPHDPPRFTFGQRVGDPTIVPGAKGDERYRLNANIDPADADLLRVIFLNRGSIQIVTANLIHEFCNTLRRLGVTDRTKLDQFHYILAARAGFDVGADTTTLACIRESVGADGDEVPALYAILPSGIAECCRREVRRRTAAQADGTGPVGDGPKGPASVRKPAKRVKKGTADASGEGEKRRGKAE